MMQLLDENRFTGCLLGLACGDAVGTTVEFKPRGSFEPVADMVGGGPFRLNAGEWTDDTSMALCLAASLTGKGGFDAADQMNRYVNWYKHGYMGSNGRCFDIGNTTSRALRLYIETDEPFSGSTHPYSAGNGCIMRLAPVPMFFVRDEAAVLQHAGDSSRTTHGAAECIEASQLFGGMLMTALLGGSKEEILAYGGFRPTLPKIIAIADGTYRGKSRDEIKGSGYVVEALEAALWCFDVTDSYKEAILMATNLGDDADTTAAICGQVAGAYYGKDAIPSSWLEKVAKRDLIEALALKLIVGGEK